MNGRLTDTPHVGVWVAGRAQFGHLVFTRSHLKLSQIYTPAIDHDATTWNGSCYRSHWMLLPRSGSLLCKSAPLPFLRTALSRHWVAPTERQTSPHLTSSIGAQRKSANLEPVTQATCSECYRRAHFDQCCKTDECPEPSPPLRCPMISSSISSH